MLVPDIDAWLAFPPDIDESDHTLGRFLLDPDLSGRMHRWRERALAGVVEPAPVVIGVVDDHELNRRLIGMVLARFLGPDNVRVVEGVSGPDAVSLRFGEDQPDLLIVNGAMPGGDGPAAIAEIRRREAASGLPRLPVVIESAGFDYLADGYAAGADASFTLPINAVALLSVVLRLIA